MILLALAATLLAVAPAPGEGAPQFDPSALGPIEGERSNLHLEPRRDGSYVYRDADSRFRAVIHPDGSVEYLPPPADAHFTLFGFDLLHRGRSEPDPGRPGAPPPPPLPGTGDPSHDPNSYGPVPILIGFGGRMPGMADMVQRSRQFSSKARFLDDTADLRRELARQVVERRTRDRLGSLEAELAEIWNDSERSASERRRRLFERWDECAEGSGETDVDDPGEGSPDDAQRAKAGERGRRQIEAFVRRNAPAGSPLAFTPGELERLNAERKSRRRFDPYARDDDPGDPATSPAQ